MENIDEFFNWWIINKYPHNKHINSLSNKWCKEFAKDYKDHCINSISDEMIEEIEENARKKGYSESLITGIRVGIDIVKQKLLNK